MQNLEELTREQRAAIKTVRAVQTPDGPRFEIELHDKLGALKQLAKSLGLNEKKPQTEAQQVHIFLDMHGDGPIDVSPVPTAIESDNGVSPRMDMR